MRRFLSFLMFIFLPMAVYGQAYPAGFVWNTTGTAKEAWTVFGSVDSPTRIMSATTVPESVTRSQLLTIPVGARVAVVQIRTGTDTLYEGRPDSKTPYTTPPLVGGTAVAYCTPTVIFFPDLAEGRQAVNWYNVFSTNPITYDIFSQGNAAAASFMQVNPTITSFGNYRFNVEGLRGMLVNMGSFSSGSAAITNASGVYVKVRFSP